MKNIPSTFPDYPGEIVLPDALTFPQILAVESILVNTRGKADALSCMTVIDKINLVVDWKIDGLPEKPTADNIFVGHDYKVAGEFYRFVLSQVTKLMFKEKEVPKVSGSGLTDTPKTQETTQSQPN